MTLPKSRPRNAAPQSASWFVDVAVSAGLFIAVLLLYAGVRQFSFVEFDDPEDVFRNPHVARGLTLAEAGWAFRTIEHSNWMPLTRLSHLVDVELYGMDAGGHHLTNVILHGAATILLFLFLRAATGSRWRSAFVAAVFALHPLHVESVAWVTERKDVLYAVFWFAALWAYVRYARRPSGLRYAAALGLFVLGLMSKPMMITLPAVLPLVDLWIERRDAFAPRRFVLEKGPFFVAAALSAIITIVAQSQGGAVRTLAVVPPALRIKNALVSCVAYVGDTFWPSGLAVFYPYPADVALWAAAAAFVMLAGASAAAVIVRRRYPFITAGWFWFVITLLPVIGLLQVGDQARADRYTYVPIVGLAIIVAWGVRELAQSWRIPKALVQASGVAVCAALAVAASAQLTSWRDTESIYVRALQVTSGNALAHNNLGYELMGKGRNAEAQSHFEAAIRIRPNDASAHNGLGLVLARVPGRFADALTHFETAVRLQPANALWRNAYGNALQSAPGHMQDAVAQLREAVRLQPDYATAHSNLGAALMQVTGEESEALAELNEAVRLEPDLASAHYNLGFLLSKSTDRLDEAAEHLRTASGLAPDFDSNYLLGVVLLKMPGRHMEALQRFEAAVRTRPRSAEAHYRIGQVLAALPGRSGEAVQHLERALALDPSITPARELLARLR